MLPKNLVFVRHGQSEGNCANRRSRAGDHSLFTLETLARHSSSWRLTDTGIRQARAAGEWLRANGLATFDRYLTSEYLRCLETAAHLNLGGAEWLVDFNLRERDHGLLDVATDAWRRTRFAEHVREFDKHRFYATLPAGETVARLCLRLKATVFADLHAYGAEHPEANVILVTHGGVMEAIRPLLERETGYAYHDREMRGEGREKMLNCQIVQYTRENPERPGEVLPHLGWTRSVCPWDLTRSTNEWRRIEFRHYSNSDLAAMVAREPRRINQE